MPEYWVGLDTRVPVTAEDQEEAEQIALESFEELLSNHKQWKNLELNVEEAEQ